MSKNADRDSVASHCYAVRLYMSLTSEWGSWEPLIKDVFLPAIPRIGEGVCVLEDSHGASTTVIGVTYMMSGKVVVELEGYKYSDKDELADDINHYKELGFVRDIA